MLGSVILLAASISLVAQRHRDPFTPQEVDQIRDASWEPQMRLALYVTFARARLVAIEQSRNDAKTVNRGQQTHDRLDDFLLIYDELNDNIDTYVERKDDLRKPLKTIIDADTEFQAKLRALKDAAGVAPQQANQYEFALTMALETVDSSADDHRKLLAEQQEAAKHRRLTSNTKPSGKPQ